MKCSENTMGKKSVVFVCFTILYPVGVFKLGKRKCEKKKKKGKPDNGWETD